MIVVATSDFEVYHGVVTELRDRSVTFTTVEPDETVPDRTAVVVTDADNAATFDGVATIVADPDDPRRAVDQALTTIRGEDGRTVIGVDPGRKPGIAVLNGGVVVAAFQVPLADAVDVIEREVRDAATPVVRIGDGSRLHGARLVNDLEDVRVELVDETGTTPYLGTGARGWKTFSPPSTSPVSRVRSSTRERSSRRKANFSSSRTARGSEATETARSTRCWRVASLPAS